jgi:hypothetical protein
MTSAVDEQGAEASPKFRVLLTASLVSSPIMFDSNIVAVSRPSKVYEFARMYSDASQQEAPSLDRGAGFVSHRSRRAGVGRAGRAVTARVG